MGNCNIGLVLSGGGAKGAYQVGMIKALAKLGLSPCAVSGTSIGALNGSTVACAPDMETAVYQLSDIWSRIAAESPLELRPEIFDSMPDNLPSDLSELFRTIGGTRIKQTVRKILNADGYFDSAPMRACLEKYLTPASFDKAMPFYVSVFPALEKRSEIMRMALAELKISDTEESTYLLVNNLPEHERLTAIMASASLPLLYKPQVVNGTPYSDGGQGNWSTEDGNTPLKPLLSCGCGVFIVSLLDNKSTWDAQRFSPAEIITLRPQRPLECKGWLPNALSFDTDAIYSWMEQGYEETILNAKLLKLAQGC